MTQDNNGTLCLESPITEYRKLINQKDGSRKIEVYKIPKNIPSKKPNELVCSVCEKQGIRTKLWKGDTLYICLHTECSVRYYWDDGVFYV